MNILSKTISSFHYTGLRRHDSLLSFWRMPESSDLIDLLDTGLRRYDNNNLNRAAVK